jgi:hypothetical protein
LGRETGGWLANRFGGVLAHANRPAPINIGADIR